MHAELAWALINLGRYEEANTELATAYETASKSGDSVQMMWVRLIDGIHDKAERHFDNANLIFKEILKDLENDPLPVLQNICLLNLTEIEIEMLTDVSLKKNSDESGPWMARLVEHAEKHDLPGIAARALLLKAELRRKQGRFDEVRKLLSAVQKTSEAPSMRYLNDLAISMFPDIIIT
jgi:tetratricopeptide (TPR) repeat protein